MIEVLLDRFQQGFKTLFKFIGLLAVLFRPLFDRAIDVIQEALAHRLRPAFHAGSAIHQAAQIPTHLFPFVDGFISGHPFGIRLSCPQLFPQHFGGLFPILQLAVNPHLMFTLGLFAQAGKLVMDGLQFITA